MKGKEPESGPPPIGRVLEEFERPLTRYAARLTGNLERAREVVQDVFLRLCGEDRARLDGRLPQWLFTVCRRRAIDVRRKEKRMRTMDAAAVLAERGAEGCDPRQEVELQELQSRLLEVLAGLSEKQQEVVRLRFQNGLSYRDIAAVTGLGVGNVGFLIHTAIRALRERMGSTEGQES